MDDDLTVEPTEDDQVVLVGFSALGPWGDMVDLETLSRCAAVGTAGVVLAS